MLIKTTCYKPNVMDQWLTLLLRICNVPGSSLFLVTGYPEIFVGFLSPYIRMLG
jgi:hypothetical protein